MDTLKIGSVICRSDDHTRIGTIVTDPCEGYPAPAGTFLINTGTEASPWYTFGILTGRTRQRWGIACPTIARFHVDTISRDGTILGVPGKAITGTWVTRPENVVAVEPRPMFEVVGSLVIDTTK